jgi:hypothetical protein
MPILRGQVIGFSIAAPVGPIGLLCIRRSMAEGQRVGLVTGLGATTVDASYGCVAAFGLTGVSSFSSAILRFSPLRRRGPRRTPQNPAVDAPPKVSRSRHSAAAEIILRFAYSAQWGYSGAERFASKEGCDRRTQGATISFDPKLRKRRAVAAKAGAVNGRFLLNFFYMNAQVHRIKAIQSPIRETSDEGWSESLLLAGFLMSESGIMLIALGNWILLNAITQKLLLVCGGLLCLLGIVLIPSWLIYRSEVDFESRFTKE